MLVPVLVARETGLLDKPVYDAAPTDVGLDEGASGSGSPAR
jgi:hypothetical protein